MLNQKDLERTIKIWSCEWAKRLTDKEATEENIWDDFVTVANETIRKHKPTQLVWYSIAYMQAVVAYYKFYRSSNQSSDDQARAMDICCRAVAIIVSEEHQQLAA